MIVLTPAQNSQSEPIMLAERDGICVGHFKLIGRMGRHADVAFRYYKDGPQEVRFPMADMWPTVEQAEKIIAQYVGGGSEPAPPADTTSERLPRTSFMRGFDGQGGTDPQGDH